MTPSNLLSDAMRITTQAEADAHLEKLVQHYQSRVPGASREDALRVERHWLRLYAWHCCDAETWERVQRLFGAP